MPEEPVPAAEQPATQFGGRVQAWNRSYIADLEKLAIGRAAAQATVPAGSRRAALVVLPQWVWLPPRIDAGRKRSAGDVPVRIEWSCDPVLVVQPETTRFPRWRALGMGWDLAGITAVRAGYFATPDPPDGAVPRRIAVVPTAVSLVRRDLAELAEGARLAQWSLLTMLDRIATRRFARAITDVVKEVAGIRTPPESVLDPIAQDALRDQLMLGTDTRESPLHSIIRRSLAPGAFARVDPLRWVNVDIRRSLEDEVRRHIGDPHIGPKFRRHVDRLDAAGALAGPGRMTLDRILADYNAAYPRDALGQRRAAAALDARETLIRAPRRVDDPEVSGADWPAARER